jgi:hypothetical protein
VAWSDLTKEDFDEHDWNRIWGWYERGGYGHVAAYLRELDISEFNPKAPPPKTPAWHDMVTSSRSPEDAEMADALDAFGNPPVTTINEIKEAAATAGMTDFVDYLADRKNSRKIPFRFTSCDYKQIRNTDSKDGLWVINGKRQVVYGKKGMTEREQRLEIKRRYNV